MSSDVAELELPACNLPDGWREVVLSDVAEVNPDTLRASTKPDFAFGYIDISQIDGSGQCAGWTEQTFGEAPSRARRRVRAGDILVSTVRPYLRSFAQVPPAPLPLVASTGFAVVRASGEADQQFLYQHILHASFIDHLTPRMTGSNYPAVSASDVEAYPINLPPLEEQRRIAEVLRSVDDAIAAADAVIGQLRETRSQRLEALMAMPGTFRRIDEICRLSGGYSFPVKHQGKAAGEYPFAKVSDMNRPGNEVQMRHAENYVDAADLRTLKAKTFPIGTTFFPKVGATLLTNKRRIAAVEMLVDNNVMGAVATDVDPWFLYYVFCTIDMAEYVQPGAVPSVNQRTIGQIVIPLPVRAVQEEFAETMRDLDTAIEMQSDALKQLAAAKQALMSDLLSGRVRVPA